MAKPRATVWPLVTSIRQPLFTLSARQPCGVFGFAQGGDVFRRSIRHGQAVQMAAVVGCQRRQKRRPPARHEAVPAIERAQAAECRIHQPELPLTVPSPTRGEGRRGPRQLVDLDLAREVRRSREEAGVVAVSRLDVGSQYGRGLQKPDLGAGGDGDAVGLHGQTHGALEVVVRKRQIAVRDPDGDDLARLVGGHE